MKGWKVLHQKYNSDNEIIMDSLIVSNEAVATSGDHYRFLVWEGKRYSHIINPTTGLGIISQRLVTIVSPSGMVADALASAFSVLDHEETQNALRNFPQARVIVAKARAGK